MGQSERFLQVEAKRTFLLKRTLKNTLILFSKIGLFKHNILNVFALYNQMRKICIAILSITVCLLSSCDFSGKKSGGSSFGDEDYSEHDMEEMVSGSSDYDLNDDHDMNSNQKGDERKEGEKDKSDKKIEDPKPDKESPSLSPAEMEMRRTLDERIRQSIPH